MFSGAPRWRAKAGARLFPVSDSVDNALGFKVAAIVYYSITGQQKGDPCEIQIDKRMWILFMC